MGGAGADEQDAGAAPPDSAPRRRRQLIPARGREPRSRVERLRRALLTWAAHSAVSGAVALVVVYGVLWAETGDRPTVEGWWVGLAVALSPALAVLFAVVPTPHNMDLVALVWRRIWRSVRLTRPSARRAWQARYGHLQTLNAWDLWGATDFIGITSERDEALRRERVDRARARRRRAGTWRHRSEDL